MTKKTHDFEPADRRSMMVLSRKEVSDLFYVITCPKTLISWVPVLSSLSRTLTRRSLSTRLDGSYKVIRTAIGTV